MIETISLGTFSITSGQIIAADPRHGGPRCGGTLSPVRRGTWRAAVLTVPGDKFDPPGTRRVARLTAHHEDASPGDSWERAPFDVGVDNGNAGLWDASVTCPSLSLRETLGATFEGGVASCSGWGDGGYTCGVQRDKKGEIIAAALSFIGEIVLTTEGAR